MNREIQMEAAEARWRQYPQLDAAVAAAAPPVMKSIERTKLQIQRVLQNGTERERERARVAQEAYARATDMYERLVKLRKVASNKGGEEPITK